MVLCLTTSNHPLSQPHCYDEYRCSLGNNRNYYQPSNAPHWHLSCKIVVWAMRCWSSRTHFWWNFFAVWEWENLQPPWCDACEALLDVRSSARQTLHRIIARRFAVIHLFILCWKIGLPLRNIPLEWSSATIVILPALRREFSYSLSSFIDMHA